MDHSGSRARDAAETRAARQRGVGGALAIATLLGLAGLASVAWWWTHPPDPAAALRSRADRLERLERFATHERGARIERWRMIAANGDTVTGAWKPPGAAARSEAWSLVILGGIGTDDRAVRLVPDGLPVGVLAVSWPWKGPVDMRGGEFVANVPAMREALLDTPAAIALAVAAVRRARPGAPVVLIGASLGVAPTVAALALTTPDALVLIDGAADLERLIASEIAAAVGGRAGRVAAPPLAAIAGRLLDPLEPSRHRAPTELPVLLVDAAREERYPRASVVRLHATFPHATRVTHPGGHLRPRDRLAVAAVVSAVWRWLESLPRRPRTP